MKELANKIRGRVQKNIEKYLDRCKNSGLILMFHEIKDYKCSERIDLEYIIRPSELERMVIELFANDSDFLPLYDFRKRKGENRRKQIFMTFDDGYEDVFLYAYPILEKYNIPFCIFLTVNFIGCQGYMSERQIRKMKENPLCTIGAHSMNHVNLRCTEAAEYEIGNSKKELEKMFCQAVDFFAYPYGSFNACSHKNLRQVMKSGYHYGFSTLQTGLTDISCLNRYYLPRLNVNSITYKEIIKRVVKVKKHEYSR